VPYLSASAVVIHYEEALYQVYAPFTSNDTSVFTEIRRKNLISRFQFC